MPENKYVKYPFEYFAAQVEFGLAVARVMKKSRTAVFKKYTDIYGALTNHMFADIPGNGWVATVLAEFEATLKSARNGEELSHNTFALFLNTPYIFEEYPPVDLDESLRFGCFKLNFSDYYQTKKVVRLHFAPLREGLSARDPELQASDLSPMHINKRKNEFSDMIRYLHNHSHEFRSATHFFSSTWLQNLPVYQSFFPPVPRTLNKSVFFWLWGQFIRWDYTGNESRYLKFKEKLHNASTFKEVFDAIPYKIYEVTIPLEKMFSYYGFTRDKKQSGFSDFLALQRSGSSPLLHKHTGYQSEE